MGLAGGQPVPEALLKRVHVCLGVQACVLAVRVGDGIGQLSGTQAVVYGGDEEGMAGLSGPGEMAPEVF